MDTVTKLLADQNGHNRRRLTIYERPLVAVGIVVIGPGSVKSAVSKRTEIENRTQIEIVVVGGVVVQTTQTTIRTVTERSAILH